jgi:hypothetical protein
VQNDNYYQWIGKTCYLVISDRSDERTGRVEGFTWDLNSHEMWLVRTL